MISVLRVRKLGWTASVFFAVVGLMSLSGCVPIEAAPSSTATPTSISPDAPTHTPSPVWFPPTDTPAPLATIAFSPTPDQRPHIGGILFAENFSTAEGWPLLNAPRGNISLGVNEITLAVLEPRAYLSSVYNPQIFSDFYVEITVRASLCSGLDEYGLLIRAASPADFYRFSLSCDGQTRVDRLYQGVASSPHPWTFSSAVPSAAPSISHLAVWASGKEMRFFINDIYQFTVTDPLISSGGIGVFARSSGENAVTINFSDLVVSEIEG